MVNWFRRFIFVIVSLFALLLTSCGQSPQSKVVKKLSSSDPSERVSAVSEMATMSSDGALVVPHVVKALDDQSEEVRRTAVGALVSLKPFAAGALKKLGQVSTKDSSSTVRAAALDALCSIAPDSSEAGDALKAALSDQDVANSMSAASKLLEGSGEKGAAASKEIALLIQRQVKESLAKGEGGGNPALASMLGQLGPKASSALPVLNEVLEESGLSKETKETLESAIKSIEGKSGPGE